jgi:hypothetical protein
MHDVRPFLPWPFERPGTLLYVGYRRDACAWLQELYDAGNEITVLEVWPNNVTSALDDPRVARFVVGDVRNAWSPLTALEPSYTHVLWWHGPEHVERKAFPGILARLASHTRDTLAVAAPWGRYDQGAHAGNPYEIHQWSVYEEDFLGQGLEVKTDGEKDKPGSEIVGWMRVG